MKNKLRTAAAADASPHQKHLLDALPASDYERIAPHLELIPMTQELIANMLGVRREGVTEAAGKPSTHTPGSVR